MLIRIGTWRTACVLVLTVALALPTAAALPARAGSSLGLAGSSQTVTAGSAHSLVVKADGSLRVFGSNTYGQLGTDTGRGFYGTNPMPTPTPVMTGRMQPSKPPNASYTSLVPGRLLESRPGATTADGQSQGIGLRPAGSVTELQVTGRSGVPEDASAAVLNVTVTGAKSDGFVTVWPCGTDKPNTSSLNFVAGQTIPNAVITKIGVGGKVCLSTTAATFLLADINGYETVR